MGLCRCCVMAMFNCLLGHGASAKITGFRLSISANNGGSGISLTNMLVNDMPPIMSSNTSGGYSASDSVGGASVFLLFDRSVSTNWVMSGVTAGYVQCIFPVGTTLDAVNTMTLYLGAGRNTTFTPRNFTLDVTHDYGATWVIRATFTNITFVSPETKILNF